MNVQYYTYTTADVRAWLYEGADNGLSEQVISKVRANAILHNPYLKDDMVIVVSATDGGKVVGFTAMFPEHLVRPDVWLTVPTTLYAHPDYAGEFIGYYVSKALHDTAEGRLVIGTDLAKETILIDKLLGLNADVFPRQRIIMRRTIPWDSMRHVLSSFYEPIRKWKQSLAIKRVVDSIPSSVRLEYTHFVDAEMYDFIVQHSDNAMFVHSQEMLNWIVTFPFVVDAPLFEYRVAQNEFASHVRHRARTLYKVYLKNQLIGVCMIYTTPENANVRMLYYDKQYKDTIYAVLLQHIWQAESKTLHSLYPDFNQFIVQKSVALKIYDEPIVFTHQDALLLSKEKQLQGIDGDMFA